MPHSRSSVERCLVQSMCRILGAFLLVCAGANAAADTVIYDNITENGFDSSCSFAAVGSDIDFVNASPVYSPSYSIRFTPDDFDAVGWCTPAAYSTLDDHAGIAFWVYLTGDEGATIDLVLANAGTDVAAQTLEALHGSPVATNVWVPIQASFAAAPMNYAGPYDEILFEDASGTIQSNVYLDELSLLPPERIFADAFEPVAPPFTVTTIASDGHGTIGPASQSVAPQGTATLRVTPDAGYTAVVNGDTCTAAPIGSSTTWVSSAITQDCALTATFVLPVQLTLAANGNGAGSVTPSPVGASCGDGCYVYDYGTPVSVTASPQTGSTFTAFAGGGCSTTNPCSVPMTGSATVTATFTLDTYHLQLGQNGNGSGTIAPSPTGTTCGANCYVYNYGDGVDVTAAASIGSTFDGFSGGGCSSASPCHVSMTATTSVVATFDLEKISITLATAGTGAGTVFPSPVGTSCGANCYTYDYGTLVSITASPSPGSSFSHFVGGGCTTTNPCHVSATASGSITAFFSSP